MDFLSATFSGQVITQSEQDQTWETLHQSTQRQTLNTLPIELQERIVIAFMRDLDTTFDEMKALRLVCRSLDVVCVRRVLSSIRLFGYDEKDVLGSFHHLTGVLSCDRLSSASTLVIPNWQWISGAELENLIHLRSLPGVGGAMLIILANATVVPLFHFCWFILSPKILPVRLFHAFIRLRAKFRLAFANEISVSNIRRVEWDIWINSPYSTVSLTARWLLKFPQLTELVLEIDDEQNLRRISRCISKLRNLRKLTLTITRPSQRRYYSGSSFVDEFGKAVARNATLTHLELFTRQNIELYRRVVASIFNHLQADSPLNLQHLGISEILGDTPAIIPHIRSLKSVHQKRPANPTIFSLLLREQIFPPVITTECIDGDFTDFIKRHPGITHLSIHQDGAVPGPSIMLISLASQHSQTLEYFCTFASALCVQLECIDNELSLLRYGRLRQIVLCWYGGFWPGNSVPGFVPFKPRTRWEPHLEVALQILARLESLSIVVFTNLAAFKECIKYCRESSNPLLKGLVQRLVFEKYALKPGY